MYAATKGINTHKGMVFSMGILCCALGLLTAESQEEAAADTGPDGAGNEDLAGMRGSRPGRKAAALCAQLAEALAAAGYGAGTHGLPSGGRGVGGVGAEAAVGV